MVFVLFSLQGASPAASTLAVSVIQNCAEDLETYVCEFLTSCIVNRDGVRSDLKEFYHEIMYEIVQYAPQMLLAVIPTLTQELLVRSPFSFLYFVFLCSIEFVNRVIVDIVNVLLPLCNTSYFLDLILVPFGQLIVWLKFAG